LEQEDSVPSSLDQTVVLRKLRTGESDLYRDFLLSLDAETRRSRFCGGVSDTYLGQHAQRVFSSGALLYGCFQDGRLCGAAELHAAAPGEPAEAAFVVSPDVQHHGIGTALLDAVVLAARNRNHPVIRVTCLRSNEAMQRLAQKADARLVLSYDEAAGEIHAPRPTALSWLREAFVDTLDTVIYTMRWPLKETQTA
jgi:RimJ/RimL family protein N-acetyltransferase